MLPILGMAAAMITQNNVATTPVDRNGEGWWKERHEACLKIQKCDIAFLGDSITQGWEGTGRATWDKEFAPLGAANFGFSGDRTEHVLWRLAHGELIPAKPKLIVIMIGTNNIGHGSSNAEQTATGVQAIVGVLRKELPKTKILLLNIFPRGPEATDPMRIAVASASSQFQAGIKDPMVTHLDIGKTFVRADGSLRNTLMPDYLHLNPDGYGLWAKAILPHVQRLLK